MKDAIGALAVLILNSCFVFAQSDRHTTNVAAPGASFQESTGAVASGEANGPVRVSGGVMIGLVENAPPPQYPEEARKANIQGAVIMMALIGSDGAVKDLKVISGPSMLRQTAVDTVSKWTDRPYILNGKPVAVNTTITVMFTINHSPQQQNP